MAKGKTKQKQKQKPKVEFYASRKRKIYKGKVAPVGSFYLEIRVEHKKKDILWCELVKAGTDEQLAAFSDKVYEAIKRKHNII